MGRTPAPRLDVRQMLGAAAVLALVVVGLSPVVAAASGLEGGASSAEAVPLPLAPDDPNAVIDASNSFGVGSGTGSTTTQPFWNNVVWYAYTPSVTSAVYIRATSTSPAGWDNTLEVWTASGQFVGHNDDSYGWDAALRVTLEAGTTYHIGLGGYWWGAKGDVQLTFSNRVPSPPLSVGATAADGGATVSWAAPLDLAGGVVRYRVLCTPDGGPETTCGEVSGAPPVTTLAIGGLVNGTTYAVRVTAENLLGFSDPSVSASVTPRASAAVSVTTEPSSAVSGEAFDLVVSVTSHGAPVPDGVVDVAVGGGDPTSVPLVAGRATVTMTRSAGVVAVEVDYPGTGAIVPAAASTTITVGRRGQLVTFDALPTGLAYAGEPVGLAATSSLELPVTFAAVGACALSDGTVLHLTGVGPCTVTATQAGDAETLPASASQAVEVGRRAQSVALADLPAMVYGQGPVAVVPVSSAGLPVEVAAAGACEMADGLLTVVGAGDCTVTASQPGDVLNAPAPPAIRTAVVAKRPQTVTLSPFPALIQGVAQVSVTAESEFGLPVTLTASGACRLEGDVVSVTAVGTCTVEATAAGDDVTAAATVVTTATVVAGPAETTAQIDGDVGEQISASPVSARGTGLLPGSLLVLTVHSDPVVIGSAVVGADGTATVFGNLPELPAGTHRLIASGVGLDGAPVEFVVALGAADDGTFVWVGAAPALPYTGADVGSAGMLAGLWLVTGAGLLVARFQLVRRARRRVATA